MTIIERLAQQVARPGAVMVLLAIGACGYPVGQPVESPQNRAQIVDAGGWQTGALTGEFTAPLYPVRVQAPYTDTMFTAVVKGPRFGYATPAGHFPSSGDLVIYGSSELSSSFGAYSIGFVNDPTDATKLRWQQSGTYKIGFDLGFQLWDVAKVTVRFNDATNTANGRAILTYRTGSSIVVSQTGSVHSIGEPLWVQAGADLPSPISFAWSISGTPLSGTSRSFIDTVFNTVGSREYVVTMTGSNGQHVNRSWTVQIVCPDGGFFC